MTHPLLNHDTEAYTVALVGLAVVYKAVKMYGSNRYNDGRKSESERWRSHTESLSSAIEGQTVVGSCASPGGPTEDDDAQ